MPKLLARDRFKVIEDLPVYDRNGQSATIKKGHAVFADLEYSIGDVVEFLWGFEMLHADRRIFVECCVPESRKDPYP
jgi:hypothetical protein